MDTKEKNIVKIKIALCIYKLVQERKMISVQKDTPSFQAHKSVTSLRKLASASGIDYSIIQKIGSGKRNPTLSTLVSICQGFEIQTSDFFLMFDKITVMEIEAMSLTIKNQKKGKRKI